MATHEVTYQGPPAHAVRAATQLADAEGLELRSAGQPEQLEGSVEAVSMALTVEGTEEAVRAAIDLISEGLPVGASVAVQPPGERRI